MLLTTKGKGYMNNTAGVLQEAGTYPSRAPEFTPPRF